jgi:hypothetical protein
LFPRINNARKPCQELKISNIAASSVAFTKFADLGKLEAHALDTSAHSVAESVEAVRRAVIAGTFRLPLVC